VFYQQKIRRKMDTEELNVLNYYEDDERYYLSIDDVDTYAKCYSIIMNNNLPRIFILNFPNGICRTKECGIERVRMDRIVLMKIYGKKIR
jgi:hypothetical protein